MNKLFLGLLILMAGCGTIRANEPIYTATLAGRDPQGPMALPESAVDDP